MPIQNSQENIGTVGEKLIAEFFDSKFSRFYSFPNPKTKSNEEVADVLIWLNRTIVLTEVKTRGNGTASTESWISGKIQEACEQLERNYKRIVNDEVINLHNSFYQTPLDCKGVFSTIGLIVLVYDDICKINPTTIVSDIYRKEFPIHVISWNDLQQMIKEIDTVPDFIYYLNDRFNYLNKYSDIPLDCELNVLGYYKSKSNHFPTTTADFSKKNFWAEYQFSMSDEIKIRNEHNEQSWWIDKLENVFSQQRKLHDGLPLGLYFVWEVSSLSRRERASFGEKINSVREWFEKGKLTRHFAFFNHSTANWLVFYFSKSETEEIFGELEKLIELKLIKEIEEVSFNRGVYGFGFQVSTTFPSRVLGLTSAIVIGADEVKIYTKNDYIECQKVWGNDDAKQVFIIKEFPTN